MGVVRVRLPSESIFSLELKTQFLYGMPFTVNPNGLLMDVDRDVYVVKSLDGNDKKSQQFILASGMNGSSLEHSIAEKLFSTAENPSYGISAIKALKIANDQGIPIYTVNNTNISTVLTQLQIDHDVKTDIRNAVNAGKVVTVSKTNINYNGWKGVGYIIINPTTGDGAYMINGGMDGGVVVVSEEGKCDKSYLLRIVENFVLTNEVIPGLLAPTGLGLLTGSKVAELMGTITFLDWIRVGFGGAVMEGVTFTSLETGVLVGATALTNFVFVGIAFEAGVVIGSFISAAVLPCNG